jgi:predicted MPP superfamily phosphohydrolase
MPDSHRQTMASLSRRDFLRGAAALGAGALAAPAAAAIGDGPRVERVTFAVPGLDPRHDGLRLAQLSDIHVGDRTPAERIAAAVALANALEPDLVVLTGDFLSRERSGVPLVREQLDGLSAPTVAVLGNHDHRLDAAGTSAALAGCGYDVLRNQHTQLRLRGARFSVVGVDDLNTGHADPVRSLAGVPRGSRLVLAHGPRTADLLRRAGEPLLVLSGHTHGGQINVPGLTSFLLRSLVREPYDRGLFHLGPVQLYVNRGIGCSGVGLRINSDPEVTLATLRLAEVA